MASKPKDGILLFDESITSMPTRRISSMSSLSSMSSFSSGKASSKGNAPYESDAVRTNYTSHAEPTNKTQQGADYESVESPTAILETRPSKPNLDFGSRSAEFQPIFVLVGAVVGIGLGIGLYYCNISEQWTMLVALPGDLFVRALQCLIVPLVFCYMTIVVTETVALGDSSIIRLRNLLPFMASSLLATGQGFCLALLFKNHFVPPAGMNSADDLDASSAVLLKCGQGMMLAYASNGTLACVPAGVTGFNGTFWMTNQTAAAAASSTSSLIEQLSLMQQIVGMFDTIVPSNIFASMANGSLLSIVMFAIPFGYAVAKTTHSDNLSTNPILTMLKQLRDIFLLMLNYLLKVTPFAVVFLMAGAIARFNSVELGKVLSEIGFLILAYIIGVACHALVVLPLFMYAITKANPFAYMRHLVPAFVFAFSCASSMATLPVSIACIQRAKVNRGVAQIAMPFGTPVNLNAVGIYYPIVAIFMANMSDHGDEWTPVRLAILFLVSFLGCMGTAPVPNSSLVYTVTLWSTCFPGVALPKAFALVVSANVLMDRTNTMLNVCGNAMVTRVLAHLVREPEVDHDCHPVEDKTEEIGVDV
ncbi:hypothetical protein Ae201684P_016565 [Aphanomyces euteiches]|uniref:Amino acid transporter n=1 Tax=Aphanomyces euteiches TaxID=100861 RepID=A0A6G0XIW7_9STRA|nr:hypothetical protein Ae201684_004492 [Aphanomyces euteiches]KAH9093945.1 hypothetical protein Ae201684P_016565 [Aphanomyces euteiches]